MLTDFFMAAIMYPRLQWVKDVAGVPDVGCYRCHVVCHGCTWKLGVLPLICSWLHVSGGPCFNICSGRTSKLF